MSEYGSTQDVERLKGEALNEFARGLAMATTIEEVRGLALIGMRGMLDIIYPSISSTFSPLPEPPHKPGVEP